MICMLTLVNSAILGNGLHIPPHGPWVVHADKSGHGQVAQNLSFRYCWEEVGVCTPYSTWESATGSSLKFTLEKRRVTGLPEIRIKTNLKKRRV